MLDVAGNRSWSDCKRVLDERGTLVIVGGPKSNRLVGSLSRAVKVRLLSIPGSRSVAAPFLANLNRKDLATLGEMLESGTVTPVIDRRYALAEAAAGLRYVAEGHAAGKVVVNVA
jgi:NADPH:quinone reductase-like Zn-dependent oxidoreductase